MQNYEKKIYVFFGSENFVKSVINIENFVHVVYECSLKWGCGCVDRNYGRSSKLNIVQNDHVNAKNDRR